jgi:hypothetical protein
VQGHLLPHDLQIDTETWVTVIEQFLMLILIIGRWMLPKGESLPPPPSHAIRQFKRNRHTEKLIMSLNAQRGSVWLGDLTRDQLSQLLLVYIGTAADIIEFFDSFKDEKIAREPILVLLTLAIWSWSLLQFTVVLTATKSRKARLSAATNIS